MTAQEIIQDFKEYINNDLYNNWYVGITSNINQRLFTDHNVRENGSGWIHAPGNSNDIARSVEKYFLDLGCNGGTGGGDNTSKIVYAYKISDNTNP